MTSLSNESATLTQSLNLSSLLNEQAELLEELKRRQNAQSIERDKEECKDLSTFLQRSWQHFDPQPYQHGWHMDAICEHLEAAAKGDIKRLLINIPPGTSKSTAVGVVFPAWLWGPHGWPSAKIIGAAHEEGLAIRDSRRNRLLIEREWFQERWPIKLVSDQNEKKAFENSHLGWRQAHPVKSMTGKRGDFVIWDDPLSPEKAYSDTDRETANRVFAETLPSRLVDPISSVIIIIMQRLHEDDVSGYIVEKDLGYEHLMLPMEFEPERKCYTSIGWEDPRTQNKELLFPERFPREVVERDKKVMGPYATAGQFQQRPAPDEGAYFTRADLKEYTTAPHNLHIYGASDYAVTDKDGDFTVHAVVGIDHMENIYVLDVWREQATTDIWIEAFIDMIERWKPLNWAEESGQILKSVGPFLTKRMRERRVFCRREQFASAANKVVRARSIQARASMGFLYLPSDAPWRESLISELLTFPAGRNDDQVDVLSLIGRMLDQMNGKQLPQPELRVSSGYQSARSADMSEDWRF